MRGEPPIGDRRAALGHNETYVRVFSARAELTPEKTVFTFLADGETVADELTYGALHLKARAVAATLQARGLSGRRALLLFPPGLEFIVAFFGCLFAGVIAVPAYPLLRKRHLPRLLSLVADCEAAAILTDSAGRRRMRKLTQGEASLDGLPWISTGEIPDDDASQWTEPSLQGEAVALLQYTSGSTATPKGVIVTHRNLLANQKAIHRAFGENDSSVIVGWLPVYHDMGLIGNVLHPPYLGARCVFMSPGSFLQRPYRWLRAISDYRATTSGGPNFAYELCLNRIAAEERQPLDLSCWQIAFNGAEPIRPQTLERFAAGFADCGFRSSAFYPCYGLAEATLLVTGGERGKEPVLQTPEPEAPSEHRVGPGPATGPDPRRRVSCGRAAEGLEARVVDPETDRPCPAGTVGELWLRGPTIAAGYWNRPEETQQVFGARLADTGEGPFLRTGDLGFLEDGEVFITGRVKDLIIVRGRNYYPQDLEITAQGSHPALQAGGGAAFGIERDGAERVVLVHELDRRVACQEAAAAASALRQAVFEEHDVQPDAVALIPAGTLPKTSSGKVRRLACRDLFVAGALATTYLWQQGDIPAEAVTAAGSADASSRDPAAQVEAWLLALLAARSGRDPGSLSPEEAASSFGLDSLSAVDVAHQLEEKTGVAVPASLFLEDLSIGDIAARVRSSQQQSSSPETTPPLPGDEQGGPVSHGQQALLVVQELAADQPLLNLAGAFQALSAVDVPALRRALEALARRHEALRTVFPKSPGQGLRRVLDHPGDMLQERDATSWSASQLRQRLQAEAARPLDLRAGPLLRLIVFHRPEPGPALLLVIHHLIADLWSLALILEELAQGYAQPFRPDNRPTPAAAPYSEFVAWQQELLRGEAADRLRRFWHDRLAGGLPRLELPTDRPRAENRRCRGDLASLPLAAATFTDLQRLAQGAKTTLFPVLLATLQILLARYSGQRDFLLGTPASGRSQRRFAGVVGYLVNLLALRAKLDGDLSFAAVLAQARRETLDALEHQDYPLSQLVEDLQPGRDPGRSPLFNVVLVLQRPPLTASLDPTALALDHAGSVVTWGDLDLETVSLGRSTAQFDLTLTAGEVDGCFLTTLQFDSDLYDRATAQRLLGHFQTLLRAAAATPTAAWTGLSLMTEPEELQILGEWSQPRHQLFATGCLHTLFEAQAALRPNAVAVTDSTASWTYRELDRRSEQLAQQLRALGVRPETPVALHLPRSRFLVAAILATLKAGGAYVPVDPAYPRERLRFVLEDSRAPVLITDQDLVEDLRDLAVQVVPGDSAPDGDGSYLPAPAASQAVVENTAYVIYTSGSTGRPKGVAISHANASRLFSATQGWFGFGPQDVWTLFHSYAFDFSVWELWGALLHGGRLVVVPHSTSRSPADFAELLRREQVTVLNQTPSAFRELVRQATALGPAAAEPFSLKWIILGGEALDLPTLAPWFQAFGDRRPVVVNMYGITETTVHVTYRPMVSEDIGAGSPSPVGVPIPDLGVFVLDRHLQPVPAGISGELQVSGAGLARGYLGRPALTAERFVPNPFSERPGARLYRSGDLGRHLPDGQLEYLGRNDQQIKIRGFRVEPGEIEAALRRHPAVAEAVVVARSLSPHDTVALVAAADPVAAPVAAEAEAEGPAAGDLRSFLKAGGSATRPAPSEVQLVAYWVPRGGVPAPTLTELHHSLAASLPAHMVPAAFVAIDRLPLTVNGKLDLKALPLPGRSRPELAERFAPPATPLQAALADDWAAVLDLDRVGVDDDLFELGGDSIRSLKLVARAEQRGVSFTLQELFSHPTVRRLAAHVERRSASEGVGGAGPTQHTQPLSLLSAADRRKLPADVEDAYPLARIQAGVIYHSQSAPTSPMYHDIFYYHLRARFDLGHLQEAIAQVVRRHPILRTSFDLTRYQEPLQLVHRQVAVPVTVLDLRGLSPAQQHRRQEEWREEEKRHPFAWDEAPLIRFFVHRLADEIFHLVLSFHDAILDGWSTASLLTAVLRRYADLLGGRVDDGEAPPAVTFRDFVAAERAALRSAEHQDFWRQTLEGARPTQLPRWRLAPPSSRAPEIWVLDVALPQALSDGLLALARQAEVPVKHVLLAAHFRTVGLLGGTDDVLTGVESNGRLEDADGDRVLGIHLNSLPYRMVLPPGDWLRLAQRTFETERELLPFRRFPLAELQKGRSGEPLFETVFNYTHFHVFQGLSGREGLEVLGARGFGQTHFTLRVEFNRDPFTDRFHLDLEGDLNRLGKAQILAIARAYRRTLETMVRDPKAHHQHSDRLSAAERHQMLIETGGPPLDDGAAAPVHLLFAQQAARTPAATALLCGEDLWSYEELERRSTALAHHLRRLGVGPEVGVGILAERSPETVLGILAVLKAGGGYIPLDPQLPADRLRYLIEDSRLGLLLTQPLHRGHSPAVEVPTLELGREVGEVAAGTRQPTAHPRSLAYVIYTSGSTGQPKGVEIGHGNLTASTLARFAYYRRPVERYLLVPPFGFDSSVAGIFWTLCSGGALVLPEASEAKDPIRLGRLVARHRVTHVLAIPTLCSLLLQHSPGEALHSLRVVIAAGEPCPPSLVSALRESVPEATLFNEYGPTEGTVWCSVQRCDPGPAPGAVPVGRPIAGSRLVLLDGSLAAVPLGVPGELYLEGAGVARGYLRRPRETAERFLPSPWASSPGERLYRSGDRMVRRTDGDLEFLGRTDGQVKLRGFRLELGEIEQRLLEHPGVLEAVAAVRDDGPSGRCLVAYFVANPPGSVSEQELRGHLRNSLPDFMVPSFFVPSERFARTPNGKVDRRRLPAPAWERPKREDIEQFLQHLEGLSDEEARALRAARALDRLGPASASRRPVENSEC